MLKKLLFILICIFCCSSFAGKYNFKNDYLYRKILDEYNIFGKNWCVVDKEELPVQLLNFKIAQEAITDNIDKGISDKILAPLEVLVFENNGTFIFYWYKNEYEIGEIEGKWKIDNSTLVLTLTTNYVKPYLKGVQLRYLIIGTDLSKSKLYLKGEGANEAAGIVKTEDDILKDFEKIITASEQQIVSKQFPKIIKAKEEQLKISLQNKSEKKK